MDSLKSIPSIRPPTPLWPAPRSTERAAKQGGETGQVVETRDVALHVQMSRALETNDADERELQIARHHTSIKEGSIERMSDAVEELHTLARRASTGHHEGEVSTAEVLAQVRELKDRIFRVAAESCPHPPRSRADTSGGTLEYPPSDLDPAALGLAGSFDFSSALRAQASAAATGQALRAIQSMRSQIAEFSREQLNKAQDEVRIARGNMEAAESALLWEESEFSESSAAEEAAAEVIEKLIGTGATSSIPLGPLAREQVSALLLA